MDYEDLYNLYLRIILGRVIIEDCNRVFVLYDPRPSDMLMGNFIQNKQLESLILSGVSTEDQLNNILLEKGLWSSDKEKYLEILNDSLQSAENSLPSLEFKSNEKKSVLSFIEEIKIKIRNLNDIKNALLINSAEYISKYETYKYYLQVLTTDIYGNKIWPNAESFSKEDNNLINRLIVNGYFGANISEEKIRKLARSEPWRSVWIAASKCGQLFPFPFTEMTEYQQALVRWSIIYDNAFESSDPPPWSVVDNDAEFNIWLKNQSERIKKTSDSKSIDSLIKNDKIRNSQEIGIVVDSFEDAQRVYTLNDDEGMKIIRSREKTVMNKGQVVDNQLPDFKFRLQLAKNNAEITHHKGKS
jgi:hypothetical protein